MQLVNLTVIDLHFLLPFAVDAVACHNLHLVVVGGCSKDWRVYSGIAMGTDNRNKSGGFVWVWRVFGGVHGYLLVLLCVL